MNSKEIIEARKMEEFGVHLRGLIVAKFPNVAAFQKRVGELMGDGTKRPSPSQLYDVFNAKRRVSEEAIARWATALDESPAELEILYDRPEIKLLRPNRSGSAHHRAGGVRSAPKPVVEERSEPDATPCISMSVGSMGLATLRIDLTDIPIDLALRVIALIGHKEGRATT